MSAHQIGVDTDDDGVNDSYTYGINTEATATLIDIAANSLWPSSTVGVENSDLNIANLITSSVTKFTRAVCSM